MGLGSVGSNCGRLHGLGVIGFRNRNEFPPEAQVRMNCDREVVLHLFHEAEDDVELNQRKNTGFIKVLA